MQSVVFIVCLFVSLAAASCPAYVPVPYYGGACGSSEVIFSPLIGIDVCHVLPNSCASGCDRQCCNNTVWEYCTACAGCSAGTTSFMTSNGQTRLYFTAPDCTGSSVQITGCTVIFNVCESDNADYTVAEIASTCVDNSTSSTSSSSGTGTSGTSGSGVSAGSSSSSSSSLDSTTTAAAASGGNANRQTSDASILSMIFL